MHMRRFRALERRRRMARYELFAGRLDREQAPVIARCPCCGGEIYDAVELEVYDGLCRECRMETVDTDTDNVFGMVEDEGRGLPRPSASQ